MPAAQFLSLLPLVLAVLLVLPVVLSPVSRAADLLVSRVALSVFGFYVANENPRRRGQRNQLRAAHVSVTHRVYASRTLLMAGVFGVAGSVFGVYLAAAALDTLAVQSETIREVLPAPLGFLGGLTSIRALSLHDLFLALLLSSATLGTLLALGVYWGRWYVLTERARTRSSEIEATLPRTVAFVFALSRSGMPFPKVLETLARNEAIYGEAAREVGIVVRDMDAFGTDVLTALQSMATRTPSPSLEEFAENLASVLGSGRNLSSFLQEQYERFQAEAEAQQQQYLDLLSTFAEVYVTVLVAGPLFFITVLVVIGLVLADTLTLIRVVGYVGIPLASFGFVVYIDSITESLRGATVADDGADTASDSVRRIGTSADGGGPPATSEATRGARTASDSPPSTASARFATGSSARSTPSDASRSPRSRSPSRWGWSGSRSGPRSPRTRRYSASPTRRTNTSSRPQSARSSSSRRSTSFGSVESAPSSGACPTSSTASPASTRPA
ncbi:flagellar assembly protein J [Haloferax massiliensis]|uniref:Flagellar assembly protein J n=1 Tax=Haloferax massiliensis TaxID=1476858 RepID=A0A0D6JRI2_9EURY|nr:flagellar assembly protein J [Haloferax massiliensis]